MAHDQQPSTPPADALGPFDPQPQGLIQADHLSAAQHDILLAASLLANAREEDVHVVMVYLNGSPHPDAQLVFDILNEALGSRLNDQ